MVVDKPKVVFVNEASNDGTVFKPRNKVHPIPTIIISDYSSNEKDKREIVIHPKQKGMNKCKTFYIRIFN